MNRGVDRRQPPADERAEHLRVGDAAEFRGEVYGLWPACVEQGAIAAANAVGGDQGVRRHDSVDDPQGGRRRPRVDRTHRCDGGGPGGRVRGSRGAPLREARGRRREDRRRDPPRLSEGGPARHRGAEERPRREPRHRGAARRRLERARAGGRRARRHEESRAGGLPPAVAGRGPLRRRGHARAARRVPARRRRASRT